MERDVMARIGRPMSVGGSGPYRVVRTHGVELRKESFHSNDDRERRRKQRGDFEAIVREKAICNGAGWIPIAVGI